MACPLMDRREDWSDHEGAEVSISQQAGPPVVTPTDLEGLDIEAPLAGIKSVDCASFGENFTVGQLVRMTDASGTTLYCYDRFGALVRKRQTTNGTAFTVRSVYAANGQLQKTIYPDNAEASYLYTTLGRIQEINVKTATGATIQLLRSASYHPFGPVAQWTYGNGRVMNRTLNQNYQPGIVQVTGRNASASYPFQSVPVVPPVLALLLAADDVRKTPAARALFAATAIGPS